MFSALDFDEGYFLQVAWHIWYQSAYRSYYQWFDPYITTGPTVLLPASLFIPLHPLAPRIVILLYNICFIYITNRYYLGSSIRAFLWILLIILLPHSQIYLTHVLGEMPGLCLVIAGYTAITNKRKLLGGIVIGLAAITKQLYILSFVPLLFTRQWKTVLSAFVPVALWQMIVLMQGTAADRIITQALAWPRPDMFVQRFTMISHELGMPVWVWLMVSMIIWTYGAQRKQFLLLSMFCWTYATYYLLLYSNYSYRTFFSLLVATVLLGIVLVPRQSVVVLLVMASIFFMILHRPQETEIVSFSEQAELAHLVRSLKGTLSGCRWFSAPELSYLARRRINREVTKSTQYYITTQHVPGCALPPFPAKRLRCNPQHCVYQKL